MDCFLAMFTTMVSYTTQLTCSGAAFILGKRLESQTKLKQFTVKANFPICAVNYLIDLIHMNYVYYILNALHMSNYILTFNI